MKFRYSTLLDERCRGFIFLYRYCINIQGMYAQFLSTYRLQFTDNEQETQFCFVSSSRSSQFMLHFVFIFLILNIYRTQYIGIETDRSASTQTVVQADKQFKY